MTRDDFVGLLLEHGFIYNTHSKEYRCLCGFVPEPLWKVVLVWAEHVADEIAAKDWCVVVRGPVADT